MNYKVYQGAELKQTVTSKTAVINGLQPNHTYDFSVQSDNGRPGEDGTNLLTGSAKIEFPLGNNNGTQTIEKYDDETNYIQHTSSTPIDRMGPWFSLTPEVGQVYTFSADVCGNGYISGDSFRYEGADNGTLGQVNLTNDWQRISNTFRINTIDGWRNWVIYANNSTLLKVKRIDIKKGSSATTSVTTRGIRFNIPKTLTVGSTITLRYEEYPLGMVPIGNEPSGMFGGGNKQNLSAKVISTANGSSVVEVAGNVIEVGGDNLLSGSEFDIGWSLPSQSTIVDGYDGHKAMHVDATGFTDGSYVDVAQTIYNADVQLIKPGEWYTMSFYAKGTGTIRTHMYPSVIDVSAGSYADGVFKAWPSGDGMYDWSLTDKYVRHSWSFKTPTTITPTTNTGIMLFRSMTGNSTYVSLPKLEPGTIATPYAAFVDGDTFTAQPDGTCALFSEYKALYY